MLDALACAVTDAVAAIDTSTWSAKTAVWEVTILAALSTELLLL